MGAGFGSWWRTKDWWIQALLWTVVINGSVAVAVWGDAPDGVDVFTLYGVMTMFAAIAVAIIMQEAIVGEKQQRNGGVGAVQAGVAGSVHAVQARSQRRRRDRHHDRHPVGVPAPAGDRWPASTCRCRGSRWARWSLR